MNYREKTRIIATFYLIESVIFVGAVVIFVAATAFYIIANNPKSFITPLFTLFVISLPVGYFCYNCIIADVKLLKSTELDRTPASIIELCKPSLYLSKVMFGLRHALLIILLMAQFIFFFYPEPSTWGMSFGYALTISSFQLALLLLFPGISGALIYFGGCWPYTFKFSLCREATTMFLFLSILLRSIALYCVIKYNNQQLELVQEVADPFTSRMESERIQMERNRNIVLYIPETATGTNMVPVPIMF